MTTVLNPTRPAVSSLIVTGIAATAAAAVATMTVAAAGHAAGVSLDLAGEPIPVTGFGVLTTVFSLIGIVLAAVLRRTATNPRRAFVRTTVALTALSLVPDVIV